MASKHSFQLPDLLSIVNSLELRTNRHCRFATESSEKWFTEAGILSENELSYLRSTKVGLLCALCFPTCDAPQLRMLTDVTTMLLYSGIRGYSCESSLRSSWNRDLPSGDLAASQLPEMYESGANMLKKHDLFAHVVDERLVNLMLKASDSWNHRFTDSMCAFRSSQESAALYQVNHTIPSLEEYVEIRKEMYASGMIFDIAELLEVFQPLQVTGKLTDKLENLKRTAFNVIALSMDVVSYQLAQSRGNTYNIVTVLMVHKNLSVQGAMNLSGNMIKDAFESFSSTERAILQFLDPPRSVCPPVLSWVWTSLAPDGNPLSPEEAEAISESVKRYIRALKDCIIGIINWVYETELFFGTKGGEIRRFGWVFVDQVPVIPS